MKMKTRKEVDPLITWDLDSLYADESQFEADQTRLKKQVDALSARELDDSLSINQLVELIRELEQVTIRMIRLHTFVSLAISSDMTDGQNQRRSNQLMLFLNPLRVKLSSLQNFLQRLPAETLTAISETAPDLKVFCDKILREQPHLLSDEVETVLTRLGNNLNLPYTIYQQAKLADMQFPDFEYAGESYPLSFVRYENYYQHHPDTGLRRQAFKVFSNRLRQSQHTIAAAYIAQVQKEKQLAELRGYASVFDYLLSEQQIPRAIYEQHLDTIFEQLAPIMRKYAGLIQQRYGLEHMTFPDLQIPLDPEYVPEVSIDEAKDYAREALAVLGPEYHAIVNKALDERWIDWAQNIGKSTGGFCSSPYGHNSFILLSWNGVLHDVFTLVHELGHAGHFQLAHAHQNQMSARPSLYFIEAPSTTNEMLLVNHLIAQNDDPRYQRFVYSSLLGNTYYHNYVTHFLEAYFQREVYRLVDQSAALTTESLHQLKQDTLSKFWGDAVDIDADAALTWMRQPHYYMGLYPYTYSAGLSLGTVMSQQITEQGDVAIERWIDTLKAGGTKTPVELAQVAGVDITKPDVLHQTMDYIETLVDRCITLSRELGDLS